MTQQLTADEIAEKLQGYVQVDDISTVELSSHIRYFTSNDDGSKTFRLGGFVYDKENADTYVVLTTGKQTWSVPTEGTSFYRKMTHLEEIAFYKKKLAEKDIAINELIQYIKRSSP